MPITLGILAGAIEQVAKISTLAVPHNSSPFISVYPFVNGFGAKYADPSTGLPNNARGVDFTPAGTNLGIAHQTSPTVSAYSFNEGFGSKYANPNSTPGNAATSFNFSDNGAFAVVANGLFQSTATLYAYPFSNGFGAKYADPAFTAETGRAIFTPNSQAVITSVRSAVLSAFAFSSSGWGSAFANPANAPGSVGTGEAVAIRPQADAVAGAFTGPPNIAAWAWSGSGFGSRFSDPASPPNVFAGYSVGYSRDGSYVLTGHDDSPFISGYAWSAGFGTKIANPSVLPPGRVRGISFNQANNVVAFGHDGSPHVSAYAWSAGFGSKFANPATSPPNSGYDLAFNSVL